MITTDMRRRRAARSAGVATPSAADARSAVTRHLRPLRRLLVAAAVLLGALVAPVLLAPSASADPCSVNANYWVPTGQRAVGDAVSPWFAGTPNIVGGPRQVQFRADHGLYYEKRDTSCNLIGRKAFLFDARYRVKECAKRGIAGIPVGCGTSGWYAAPSRGCPSQYTQSNIENDSRAGCNIYTLHNNVWNGGDPGPR